MKPKAMFAIAAPTLLLAVVLIALGYRSGKPEESLQLTERNEPQLVRMHSPALGAPEAPVVIVEFLDPACETCRAFYPFVKELMAANPGKIRLVLRYLPLHNGSDKVVAVLEAARKQGKFWPALEALLAAQPDWAPHHTAEVDLVWRHLEGVGLDLDQVRTDMLAAGVASVIAQDLEDAKALRITKTPEFFVNGKPLASFGYRQLKDLVDEALISAPR